jgi:hypothetical protein
MFTAKSGDFDSLPDLIAFILNLRNEKYWACIANQTTVGNHLIHGCLYLFQMATDLPPNGPELSCGGEQPPQGSSLRGRSDQMR